MTKQTTIVVIGSLSIKDALTRYRQHMFLMENGTILSQNYHQILLSNKSVTSPLSVSEEKLSP